LEFSNAKYLNSSANFTQFDLVYYLTRPIIISFINEEGASHQPLEEKNDQQEFSYVGQGIGKEQSMDGPIN
jgi:hypothetical protein